ncbi:uncharacterized protein LOC108596874 [Drosophila busckii]|uniref:uncharacterized protein LOC108596874 n=1 Tax=Drosophila busckii TaxID=30019 RepID=UPI00083EBCBC|nr:uncharacterized protein LOC108596874 [Drosophila busckii]
MQNKIICSLLLLLLLAFFHCQAAPADSSIINSLVDISGEPVRQQRVQANDYFICYPSSVVYSYHNELAANRRSGSNARQPAAVYDFDAAKDRADRKRAELEAKFYYP